MNNIDRIFIVIGIVISFFLGVFIGKEEFSYKNNNKEIIVDTSYNKIILDSIEYNINKKDSTITEIKKKFEYEKNKALNTSDSDAIKQFIKLASE